MSQRERIIDAVFAQEGRDFTGSTIVEESEVDPKDVNVVINLMDCVTKRHTISGKQKSRNIYTVTGNLPDCCGVCDLNSPDGSSCRRAPNFHNVAESSSLTPLKIYQDMCVEAQNGDLTNKFGNRIVSRGHWNGKKFIMHGDP